MSTVEVDLEILEEAASEFLPRGVDIERIADDIADVYGRLSMCTDSDPLSVDGHDRPIVDVDWPSRAQAKAVRLVLARRNFEQLAERNFENVIFSTPDKTLCMVEYVDGRYIRRDFDTDDMVMAAEEAVCFTRIREDKTGIKVKHVSPSKAVKRHLVSDDYPAPVLRNVRVTPAWYRDSRGDLEVITEEGYHPEIETFLGRPFPVMRSEAPSPVDVERALEVIDEVIGEFPFADNASRTNTIAMLITMSMRRVFDTAPAWVIGAHDKDSGKSLLVEVATSLVEGKVGSALEMSFGEAGQVRRNLTAMFRDASSDTMWFDEPRKSTSTEAMVSPLLNRALTAASGEYKDRPVMTREVITLDTRRNIVMTGNNLMLGGELERRTVRIMMSRSTGRYSRTEDELRKLALRRHEAFHQAVVTLVDNWRAAGSPESSLRLNSFNDWAKVVGGIVEAAGLTDLRNNEATLNDPHEHSRADWLLWLLSAAERAGSCLPGASSVTLTVEDAALLMDGPHVARDKWLQDILLQLATDAPKGEKSLWNALYKRPGSKFSPRVVKVVGDALRAAATLETSKTAEGAVVHVVRAERGTSGPVRYTVTAR